MRLLTFGLLSTSLAGAKENNKSESQNYYNSIYMCIQLNGLCVCVYELYFRLPSDSIDTEELSASLLAGEM